MFVGIVYVPEPIKVELLKAGTVKKMILSAVMVIVTVILMFACVNATSKSQIMPLRQFNFKMRDIMSQKILTDLENKQDGCQEVNDLYSVF